MLSMKVMRKEGPQPVLSIAHRHHHRPAVLQHHRLIPALVDMPAQPMRPVESTTVTDVQPAHPAMCHREFKSAKQGELLFERTDRVTMNHDAVH